MRDADGVTGDVRDALYEAVGVRPTQCAQWVHCALKGAKTRECYRDGRWSAARSATQDNSKTSTTTRKVTPQLHQITEDRGPRTEESVSSRVVYRRMLPCQSPNRINSRPYESKFWRYFLGPRFILRSCYMLLLHTRTLVLYYYCI